MGYRKVVLGNEVYMMTPKWYKEFQKHIKTLNELENTDYDEIDTAELVDIRDVNIDKKQPQFYRIMMFVNQIKNPYCFRVGDIRVKVKYAKEPKETMTETFSAMLAML